ncbi:hypothetical protein HUJ04_006964 [Dendroctonus ponderosae]|nr:hypothetical protein HUJ04_006964 [Dendroctonus ponderosae]
MRRERFVQIMKVLHCADNSRLDPADKMAKLRPLINEIKKNILDNYIPNKEVNYDESMIEYFGRHECKQYIRNIPNFHADHQERFGQATAPLLQLVKSYPDNIKSLPFHFYLDNLFTSMNLLYFLRSNGYQGTGTVRENRLPKNCSIQSVKSMKKQNRGTFEYAATTDKKN